ncbi:MAG: hypothetical protein WKF30_09600 [Pyrinomonadaceae bacterium]
MKAADKTFNESSLALRSSFRLPPSAFQGADLAAEVARLESVLVERKKELVDLQQEFRAFKMRYASVVGSRLAELAEVEGRIKEAEARWLGVDFVDEAQNDSAMADGAQTETPLIGKTLRKLFWSVAKMFHPDHAADEEEAHRRHSIMAEANRAYQEGDADSLHTLLDDTEFRSYCAGVRSDEREHDLTAQLINLKEELLTIEFGLKRIKQDSLYQIKVFADEEAGRGRDALAATAENIRRRIIKADHRLAHLS